MSYFRVFRYDTFDANLKTTTIAAKTTVPTINIENLTPYTNYKFSVKRERDLGYPTIPTLKSRTLEASKYCFSDF